MYRYSTEPMEILLPFDPNSTEKLWLTFVQEENEIEITRTKEELADELADTVQTEDGLYSFPFAFTQEESKSFSASYPILAQIRFSMGEGHSDVTSVYSFRLKDVLKEGVI